LKAISRAAEKRKKGLCNDLMFKKSTLEGIKNLQIGRNLRGGPGLGLSPTFALI
jgi:hypothetical protein